MSRSFKHTPCYVIGCKKDKRIASRKVRHFKGDLKSFCFYKRIYESYNIRDYVFLSYEEKRKNKEFRRVAKIVRDVIRGKLSPEDIDFGNLLEILEDCEDSFFYLKK